MGAAHRQPALSAYEPFADLYDLFTADHDYESWVSSIESLVCRAGLRGCTLLDVACGTGKSLMPWLKRGYVVSGCDLSPRMLAHARRKVDGRARLFCADMRRLPEGRTVDLVTCLDDAVNYLLDPDDLRRAFACAAERLHPGGVYVFDLNSLHAYRGEFARDRSFVRGGWKFNWVGHGDTTALPGSASMATIIAHSVDASRRSSIRSRHHQRHHPMPLVSGSLAGCGFRDVSVYGQHRDGSLDDDFDELVHAKAIVVARKGSLDK